MQVQIHLLVYQESLFTDFLSIQQNRHNHVENFVDNVNNLIYTTSYQHLLSNFSG